MLCDTVGGLKLAEGTGVVVIVSAIGSRQAARPAADSPDHDPIEVVFNKIKQALNSLAWRSVETIMSSFRVCSIASW